MGEGGRTIDWGWVQWLVALIGAAYCAIGVSGAAAPERASRSYGVEADGGRSVRAWVSAAAWRDLAIGAAIVLIAFTAEPGAAAVALGAAVLIPLGDIAILARHGGVPRKAYLPHAVGAVAAAGVMVLVLTLL